MTESALSARLESLKRASLETGEGSRGGFKIYMPLGVVKKTVHLRKRYYKLCFINKIEVVAFRYILRNIKILIIKWETHIIIVADVRLARTFKH